MKLLKSLLFSKDRKEDKEMMPYRMRINNQSKTRDIIG